MIDSLLRLDRLTVRFGGLVAVDDLSFAVRTGSIHALIGPNGAGKTTIFNAVTRLATPAQGRIEFSGRDLLRVPPHDVVRAGIARTFQNVESFPTMTVRENLLVGCHPHFAVPWWAAAIGSRRARAAERDARDRVDRTLDVLALSPVGDWLISNLPLAMQKRVELGRALMARPKLLILDEPAAGLNDAETIGMGSLLREIRSAMGITILLVEHNMPLVMSVSDQVTVINFGRFVAEGTPEEVRADPTVQSVYLGEESAGA